MVGIHVPRLDAMVLVRGRQKRTLCSERIVCRGVVTDILPVGIMLPQPRGG
jgi:hypothetical protein